MRNAGKLDLPDDRMRNAECIILRRSFWHCGIPSVPDIQLCASGNSNAAIMSVIGDAGIIWGFGEERLHFLPTRWKNTSRFSYYLDHSASPRDITEDIEELSVKDEVEEFMFLGLRMNDGITAEAFKKAFSLDLLVRLRRSSEKYEKEGLMEHSGGRYFLTSRGADISNTVLSGFLL